jgi:hypothetical protein
MPHDVLTQFRRAYALSREGLPEHAGIEALLRCAVRIAEQQPPDEQRRVAGLLLAEASCLSGGTELILAKVPLGTLPAV